jgi:hypothetical protein
MVQHTDPPRVKENTRSFRVNLDLWARFRAAAAANNRTRGGQLNELMEEFTLNYERTRDAA